MEFNPELQKRLLDHYKGDAAELDSDVRVAIDGFLSWNDIIVDETVATDYQSHCEFVIKEVLGYLPRKSSRIRYEGHIRASLKLYIEGIIEWEKCQDDMYPLLGCIRNRALLIHTGITYPKYSYALHENYLLEYKYLANERIEKVLGYKPSLDCSLMVDLHYRKLFEYQPEIFINALTETDIQGAEIIRFREILLKQDLSSAYNMSFIKGSLIERFGTGEIIFDRDY